MTKCFSIASTMNSCYKLSFKLKGLKSTATKLHNNSTIIHCWIPKSPKSTKPNLLIIHGIGANAMWQWNDFLSSLTSLFNVYIPDLLFFGGSHTSLHERTEGFQAECVVKALEANGVVKMHVAGLSYGGFVAYSIASMYPERVERLVLCCAGVCGEEKDMEDGSFEIKSVDQAVGVLFPQSVDKVKELLKLTFYKPPRSVPSCIFQDFIDVMCKEYLQERKELVQELHKDRKMSNIPKITHPTLIIWGEYDKIFPLELAYRLKRHIGETARLVVLKNAGHAINKEKPKEMRKHLKSFLVDPLPPSMKENHSNGSQVE